jgi:hypothetical protein
MMMGVSSLLETSRSSQRGQTGVVLAAIPAWQQQQQPALLQQQRQHTWRELRQLALPDQVTDFLNLLAAAKHHRQQCSQRRHRR